MENNELIVQKQAQALVENPQNEIAQVNVWSNREQFNQLLRAANMLSQTNIIAQRYQGKPQDCFVAIEMATRMGVSPMVVMQNMYVVKISRTGIGNAAGQHRFDLLR